MSISYRWKNETGPYREINIPSSAIRVADLKVIIAERSGLSQEFARKIDILLLRSEHDKDTIPNPQQPKEPNYYDEDDLIEPFTRVIAIRVPWKSHNAISHRAKTQLSQIDWGPNFSLDSKRKKAVPQEFLCTICGRPMTDPILMKCTQNCSNNACKKCLEDGEVQYCLTCGGAITGKINNRLLHRMIESTNWDNFEIDSDHINSINKEEDSFHIASNTSFPSPTSVFDTNISNSPSSLSNKNQSLNYPFYLIELSASNLSLLREYNLILVTSNSLISQQFSEFPEEIKICIVPCAQAGGGTSYAIGGFCSISSQGKVNMDDLETSEFLHKFYKGLDKNKIFDFFTMKEEGHIFRINWEEKFEIMPMLPKRRQPLWNILNSRNSNVHLKSNFSPTDLSKFLISEVSIQESKYEELVNCIKEYIKYGSRPGEPYPSEHSGISSSSVGNKLDPEPTKNIDKLSNKRSIPIRRLHMIPSQIGTRDLNKPPYVLNLFGGPIPLGVANNLDPLNPYIGYCSCLPFLTKHQFKKIKLLQLLSKQYIKNKKSVSQKIS